MPRLTKALPKYSKHSSGQARVTINGRDYLLGPYGTAASKREYDRVIAEYCASGRSDSFGISSVDYTMAMLMADYLAYAKGYYGTGPNSEYRPIKYAIRPVKKIYAALLVVNFGFSQFKIVRESMIQNGLRRSTINAQTKRIVRMIKWAVAEEKIPATIFDTLRWIPALKKGRSVALEADPVKPVPVDVVGATLAVLPVVVADMVRVQLLSGCRPGEVCMLTTATYGRAIKRAAKKAGVEHWSPNQLRHTRGTDVRKQFGLEAAQVTLGHASADVTQTYAERDDELARTVARQTG